MAMCDACKHGGFHPDIISGGICPDCIRLPAICAGCRWETQRGELNEDLRCRECAPPRPMPHYRNRREESSSDYDTRAERDMDFQ